MLVEDIKSRPVYTTLSPRPGHAQIVVAEGEGATAVSDLLSSADAGFLERTHVLFRPTPGGPPGPAIERAALASYDEAATDADILTGLAALLGAAGMGTQVYLAGTEAFIGRTMVVALEAGIDHQAIQAEHRGSLERRVQCVHCKTVTDHVRTQPVVCSGCGLTLLVRDHYSRRIGAFQGVCIDAEEPGTAPPAEEIFA